MRRFFYIILLIKMLVFQSCEDQVIEENSIDIGREIMMEMARQGIPSVAASVVRGDELVWSGAYGFSDHEQSVAVTEQTIYTIMSVSKLFLAISVMQLWEQGLVDLEKDISEYLPFHLRHPDYPDVEITPYFLLTHRSGLVRPWEEDGIPEFYFFFPEDEEPQISEWLPEYILPGGSNYTPRIWKDFKPGTKEQYSNIGTTVLALLVEEVSGMDYRDYVHDKILSPLQMNSSGFRFKDLDYDLLAQPHYDNGHPMAQYNLRAYPVGSLKSNLMDLSHFVTAILNKGEYNGNRIMSEKTFDKMVELQNPGTGIAFLWYHCLGNCIGHDGGGTGFRTLLEIYPEENKGIIILSNIVNNSVASGRIYELVRYQSLKY